MAQRTPCFRRCSTIRVASPNQEGVERTDWEEVWMITDPSAILFIGASLMEVVLFFLLKEAHFYLCSLQVTSRCASRGKDRGLHICLRLKKRSRKKKGKQGRTMNRSTRGGSLQTISLWRPVAT